MRLFLISIFLLIFSAAAFGQNGSITGTVTFGGDKSVLHQATVRVVQLDETHGRLVQHTLIAAERHRARDRPVLAESCGGENK